MYNVVHSQLFLTIIQNLNITTYWITTKYVHKTTEIGDFSLIIKMVFIHNLIYS